MLQAFHAEKGCGFWHRPAYGSTSRRSLGRAGRYLAALPPVQSPSRRLPRWRCARGMRLRHQ
nr:MAG TPA: hypothetical protein [Caudoviricetes sp.]